jgi:hypothetical protein
MIDLPANGRQRSISAEFRACRCGLRAALRLLPARPMKISLLLPLLLTLVGGSVATAAPRGAKAEVRFVKINGSVARARVQRMFAGDLRGQNRMTPADVDGKSITKLAALRARQTENGFENLNYKIKATTYVTTHRNGSPKRMLVTVSGDVRPGTNGPTERYFVARSATSGYVVARGHISGQGKVTWTRGKNGDGPAERNLAR